MGRDAEQHVKNCEPCLLAGKSTRAAVTGMRPIALPPHPWHTVAVDIKGPLHNAPESHKFLVVAFDLYSKWPLVQPTTSIGSQAVLQFFKSLLNDWGLPKARSPTMVASSCPQRWNDSSANSAFTLRTALYHPQANGAVERFNRVITDAVRLARGEQRSVADDLFACVSANSATPEATTGISPLELMIRRKIALPPDRLTRGFYKAGRLDDPSIQDHVG